jgi:hypothetical protein
MLSTRDYQGITTDGKLIPTEGFRRRIAECIAEDDSRISRCSRASDADNDEEEVDDPPIDNGALAGFYRELQKRFDTAREADRQVN